jgi:hypothetical protein
MTSHAVCWLNTIGALVNQHPAIRSIIRGSVVAGNGATYSQASCCKTPRRGISTSSQTWLK